MQTIIIIILVGIILWSYRKKTKCYTKEELLKANDEVNPYFDNNALLNAIINHIDKSKQK